MLSKKLCPEKNYAQQKTLPGNNLCPAQSYGTCGYFMAPYGNLRHFILVSSDKEILCPAALIKAAKLAPASMPAPAAKLQAATRCAHSAKLPTANE